MQCAVVYLIEYVVHPGIFTLAVWESENMELSNHYTKVEGSGADEGEGGGERNVGGEVAEPETEDEKVGGAVKRSNLHMGFVQ